MDIDFVAGFGPIVTDPERSAELYEGALAIPFILEEGGYRHSDALEGVRHFALWPLTSAAESCFGSPHWPEDRAVPQAWIEFDVPDVGAASAELEARGYELVVRDRLEPWGQTVTRLLSPEGLLVGITHTPWQRDDGPTV